jgi:sialic acid synthase SpsE
MPIIAEIGQNHCGNMKLALDLMKEANDYGAWGVKFQLYDSVKAYGSKQKSELSYGQAETLVQFGKDKGIKVFFSVFDEERVDWCKGWHLDYYKIAYSQRNNEKLIDCIPEEATCFISTKSPNDYTDPPCWCNRLFCIPRYPVDPISITLPSFQDFEGYSDHTIGIDVARIALARGAYWIEKHYAKDHETGVDANWSMTAAQLLELVKFEEMSNCV